MLANFKISFLQYSKNWKKINTKFLPFADAASEKLPLYKLLQLSLFQVSVGIGIVLLVGTLNRVMIVELGVSATIVALMVAIPVLFAPIRAFVGFRSDTHKSAIGWRRIPYIWVGSLLQFGGLTIMPFALILLSGDTHWPYWFAFFASGFSFLLVGSGIQIVQTTGLALATDVSPENVRPRVVALMYTMLLVGMAASSIFMSFLLEPFSQIRLIQVIQGVAVFCFFLNLIALWKQEARNPKSTKEQQNNPPFFQIWRKFSSSKSTKRFFWALAFGTAAFSMQDIILEPYGGEILGLSVSQTTLLSAFSSVGAVVSFGLAAWLLNKKINPHRLAAFGVLLGIVGFSLIVFAKPMDLINLFKLGVFLIGFGGGMFSVSCLVSAMYLNSGGYTGLVLGAWGAIQATAMGFGVALGGILRDLVENLFFSGVLGTGLSANFAGYLAVYHLEILLLFLVLIIIGPLVGSSRSLDSISSKKFGLAEFPS